MSSPPKSLIIGITLIAMCLKLAECVILDANNPIATTMHGRVRGQIYTYSQMNQPGQYPNAGKKIMQFIGIPFGKSPAGFNRFRQPVPPDPWEGEWDATANRVMCPQVEQRFTFQQTQQIREDEDCLYLNVYVPIPGQLNTGNYPVMVYFHPGEFKFGGKDFFKPDYIVGDQQANVILVVPNYRLGILGFLGTDDINAPGNFGIRDQTLALQWVNKNIQNFGGNPQNVTIFGHDAGAISASIHLFNQESAGLFTAVMSLGGTVFTPWAFANNPKLQAMDFARKFDCEVRFERLDRLVECLRYQDVGALLGRSRERDWANNIQRWWFRPVIDRNVTQSPVFRDWPIRLYERGEFAKVPFLAGVTKDEGSLDYYLHYNRIKDLPTTVDKLRYLVRPYLREFANDSVIASAINYNYFSRWNQTNRNMYNPYQSYQQPYNRPGVPIPPGSNANYQSPFIQQQASNQAQMYPSDVNRAYIEAIGDFLYTSPSDKALKIHSIFEGRTYFYVFTYDRGQKSFGDIQRDAAPVSGQTYGVTHMDDLFYMLPNDYNVVPMAQYDEQVARNYIQHILQFARFGAFGSQAGGSFIGNGWRPYSRTEANYAIFGSTQTTFGVDYHGANVDFWNDFVFDLQTLTANPWPDFPYYKLNDYQAATWSVIAVCILLLVLVVALAAVILSTRRKEKRTMKLLRAQDKELEERYNNP